MNNQTLPQGVSFIAVPSEVWMRMQDTLGEIQKALDEAKKPDSWLNTKEAAKLLNVTPITLAKYRDKYHIKTSNVGRYCLYSSNDINKLLEKKTR